MPYVPVKTKFTDSTLEKRLNRMDGGLNCKFHESLISDEQAAEILNMNANDRGALTKRQGQVVVHTFNGGPMHAITYYKGKWVAAHGTKISTWDGTTETEIASGLANNDGKFFFFSDYLLYLNHADFKQYDGTSCTNVEDSAYVPTLTVGRLATGGGTPYEQWNLLTPKFKDSFSPDGTATTFPMSLTNLDATPVIAWLNGVQKTEGTDFTFNRTTGIATFNSAPPAGTNTLIIQAAKTMAGFADRVKKCRYVELYGGGSNDTRLFIAGNDNYKNVYRYTGLTGNTRYDFSYWPENSFNRIGSDAKLITGFAKYYGKLVTTKENQIFSITYKYQEGTSTFPVESLNSQMGCDMPGGIQIICDAPIFPNTQYGVHTILSTLLENEKNVKPLSANIEGSTFRTGLLDMDYNDMVNCSSVDFDGKYWLNVGDKVYLWDYKLSPYPNGMTDDSLKWFYYDNITASCFYIHDRELYYGDRNSGNLVKFIDNWNDFGQPIFAYWKSKLFNFDLPEWEKTISELWFITRSGTNTNITVTLYDDNDVIVDTIQIKSKSFSWADFKWSEFTWKVYRFPITKKMKPKLKKIKNFQVAFSNNELNKNLSIMGLIIKYSLDRQVK